MSAPSRDPELRIAIVMCVVWAIATAIGVTIALAWGVSDLISGPAIVGTIGYPIATAQLAWILYQRSREKSRGRQ